MAVDEPTDHDTGAVTTKILLVVGTGGFPHAGKDHAMLI
jgi:hypothetical protein